MEKWVTRVSRAVMMGLAWAAVWIPIGVVGARIFVGELDPEHIGGPLYAGVLCGTLFSVLTGLASGRRLDELSFSRAATRGALSGLLVGMLPFVIGDVHGDVSAWWLAAAVIGSLVPLSAVSAVGSVWLAKLENRGHAVADVR